MKLLPDASLWIDSAAEDLLTRVRAWQTVINTLIGPITEDGLGEDDRAYLPRASSVKLLLDEYESRLLCGLTVQPSKIAEDLEWVLQRASPMTREILLAHYQSVAAQGRYEEVLGNWKRLMNAQGVDSPEIEKMKQQVISQGDQVEALASDFLRTLLRLHPSAASRVPGDVMERLGDKAEMDGGTEDSN